MENNEQSPENQLATHIIKSLVEEPYKWDDGELLIYGPHGWILETGIGINSWGLKRPHLIRWSKDTSTEIQNAIIKMRAIRTADMINKLNSATPEKQSIAIALFNSILPVITAILFFAILALIIMF